MMLDIEACERYEEYTVAVSKLLGTFKRHGLINLVELQRVKRKLFILGQRRYAVNDRKLRKYFELKKI